MDGSAQAGQPQFWRVWLRQNAKPLEALCELCGCFTIATVPTTFFYEFDDSKFPVCARCAINYGVRLPPELCVQDR